MKQPAIIFLRSTNTTPSYLSYLRERYPQLTPFFFSYSAEPTALPHAHILIPGQEFTGITQTLHDYEPKAVINFSDAFEILHGQLVDYFQLPGPSLAAITACKDKSTFHQLITQYGLAAFRPQTTIVPLANLATTLQAIPLPVVIKPFAGAKSRGVQTLRSQPDMARVVNILTRHFLQERSLMVKHNPHQHVLIEEYLEGKQVTCTAYVDQNGQLHLLDFVDVTTANDLGQHHMQLVYRNSPSQHPPKILAAITSLLAKLVTITGIKSTLIHPEFFVVGKRVYVIEINVRLGGFRARLLRNSSGIDLHLLGIDLALGQPVAYDATTNFSSCAAEVWEEKSGIVGSLTFPNHPELVLVKQTIGSGELYQAPPVGNKPLARFYVTSSVNALTTAQLIRNQIKITWLSQT